MNTPNKKYKPIIWMVLKIPKICIKWGGKLEGVTLLRPKKQYYSSGA